MRFLIIVAASLLILSILISPSNGQSASNPQSEAPSPTQAATSQAQSQPASQPASSAASAPASPPASQTSSAAAPTKTPASNSCYDADPYNSKTDYFPDKIVNDESGKAPKYKSPAGFIIEYHNTYKFVSLLQTGEAYLLYCTKDPPSFGNSTVLRSIQVPVKNIAIEEPSIVGYLDLLGQSNLIKYANNPAMVTSPCISNAPSQLDSSSTYDILFSNRSNPTDSRVVVSTLSNDLGPLEKAEWLYFYSTFFSLEARAKEIFPKIEAAYNCHRDNLQNAKITYKRNMTWELHDNVNYNAFVVQFSPYYKSLTTDAGGEFKVPLAPASAGGDPSRFFESSAFRGALQNISHLIDMTFYTPNLDDWLALAGYNLTQANISDHKQREAALQDPDRVYVNSFDAPPFIRRQQLWRVDATANGNSYPDFASRGAARPDLVLQDLIAAQFPDYNDKYTRVFLRNFFKEAPRSPSADGYGCSGSMPDFGECRDISLEDKSSDDPLLTPESGPTDIPFAAKIVLYVVAGIVGLALIAGIAVAVRRKIKNRRTFTKLQGDDAFDLPKSGDEPVYTSPAPGASGGRFGGGGRGAEEIQMA